MFSEVATEVWVVTMSAVVLNAVISLLINIVAAKASYRRGYNAAQTAIEALALGRLYEASRERYYAGDALARVLEEEADAQSAGPLDLPDGER